MCCKLPVDLAARDLAREYITIFEAPPVTFRAAAYVNNTVLINGHHKSETTKLRYEYGAKFLTRMLGVYFYSWIIIIFIHQNTW